MIDKNGFVFKDALGRNYKCQVIDGEKWLLYWNTSFHCWTTLRPLEEGEVEKYKLYEVQETDVLDALV